MVRLFHWYCLYIIKWWWVKENSPENAPNFCSMQSVLWPGWQVCCWLDFKLESPAVHNIVWNCELKKGLCPHHTCEWLCDCDFDSGLWFQFNAILIFQVKMILIQWISNSICNLIKWFQFHSNSMHQNAKWQKISLISIPIPIQCIEKPKWIWMKRFYIQFRFQCIQKKKTHTQVYEMWFWSTLQ